MNDKNDEETIIITWNNLKANARIVMICQN